MRRRQQLRRGDNSSDDNVPSFFVLSRISSATTTQTAATTLTTTTTPAKTTAHRSWVSQSARNLCSSPENELRSLAGENPRFTTKKHPTKSENVQILSRFMAQVLI